MYAEDSLVEDSLMETPPPSFGDLLKRFRKAAGLTQEALAVQAGLSMHGVSDLERGINRAPRKETLDALVKVLRLSAREGAELKGLIDRGRHPLSDAAPLNAASLPPAPLTPLVGRAADVAAMTALLRGDARLLTLTGPGGVGKTQLALHLAAAVRRDFANGVMFVSLTAVADADLVLTTIAQAVGLSEQDERPPRDALVAYLADKDALLLLDNFEQVLAAAPLVADVAALCPTLRILVTSRAILRVRGERAYVLEPLLLPDHPRARTAAAIADCAAAQLFLARAQDSSPGFALTDANAALIARICAQLDGLPLAIELAAARLKLLAPPALLARLESGLQVLAGGARDLPAHQRTLRDTLAWSYGLLDAPAQALFLRLAVFAGGCTAEAAENLYGAAGDPMDVDGVAEPADVLDTLSALVDNNLLRRVERPDEVRFTMLVTVREYALEQLTTRGARGSVQQQHAAYYLALAEAADPDQPDAAARLEREKDNLRAALGWALDSGHVETALRLAGALRWFWLSRGYLSEGRRWLARALSAADAGELGEDIMASGLNNAAVLAATAGAYDEAAVLFERGLAIRRTIGDDRGSAAVLNNLGNVAMQQRAYDRANAYFTEALALSRTLNEARGSARVLGNLGELARLRGDSARASAWATESLTLYTQLQDTAGVAQALHTLACTALLRDDIPGAAAAYVEALSQSRRLGNGVETVNNLEGLAVVASRRQHLDHAAMLFGAAAAARGVNDTPTPPADRARNEQALAVIRAELGEERFAAAWTTGQELPLEKAVAAALDSASCDGTGALGSTVTMIDRTRRRAHAC